ncbi:MAG: hypothetical protein IT342_06810 [Candidatus Melainabacteria bacterium]|nr:hypothetical protein [Candidatus Melainabacteria bacterium]
MTDDTNEKKDYPWENQRTVLRDIDLRKFGARPANLKLSSLWKSAGQEVIAILRAEMQKARNMESKKEADS